MTIAVAGTGYVGLSIATLLAQHHKVLAVDIVEELEDFGCNVDIYDPWASNEIVKHEYGKELIAAYDPDKE